MFHFVVLAQETQAFRPQSRQGGPKVRQFCQGGRGSISVFITSNVAISAKYKNKTLSGLEPSRFMWRFISFFAP
jgi:hypothetical protein